MVKKKIFLLAAISMQLMFYSCFEENGESIIDPFFSDISKDTYSYDDKDSSLIGTWYILATPENGNNTIYLNLFDTGYSLIEYINCPQNALCKPDLDEKGIWATNADSLYLRIYSTQNHRSFAFSKTSNTLTLINENGDKLLQKE